MYSTIRISIAAMFQYNLPIIFVDILPLQNCGVDDVIIYFICIF